MSSTTPPGAAAEHLLVFPRKSGCKATSSSARGLGACCGVPRRRPWPRQFDDLQPFPRPVGPGFPPFASPFCCWPVPFPPLCDCLLLAFVLPLPFPLPWWLPLLVAALGLGWAWVWGFSFGLGSGLGGGFAQKVVENSLLHLLGCERLSGGCCKSLL